MAWTPSSISAGELSALASDAPLIVPYNIVADAFTSKWTADGDNTSADITLSTAPAHWAADGELRYGTTRTAGSASAHYFNLRWATSTSFDTLFLKLLGATVIDSVAVQISDDGTTWSTTLCTWSSSISPTGRMIALNLNSGTNRYTGTGYMRVVFTMFSSTSAPTIAEFFVGRRRQISRRPDQRTGYDDAPRGVAFTDQQFRGRDRQRYIEAEGFTDWVAGFTPTGTDAFGLDDVSTFRAIVDDSNGLRMPMLWVDRPSSAPSFTTLGFLNLGSDGLMMPYEAWAERSLAVRHEEIPPFARNDSRYAV